VAKFMREHRNAEFASGLLYRALDIGFVHPVAILEVGTGMKAGIVRRKEPGPRPGISILRVFPGELERQIQLLFAGERDRHGFQGGDVFAEPIDVGGFGGDSFVLTAQHVA